MLIFKLSIQYLELQAANITKSLQFLATMKTNIEAGKISIWSSLLFAALTGAVTVNANAQPQVVGNEIVVPAGDWYQVQNAETFESVCEGVLRCRVSNGSFIVINHSTGERFDGVVVDDNETTANPPPVSNLQVNGNQISWPDDGWYQVQRTSDYSTVCEGGRSCEVDAGEYVVINHSTMQRFENIVVSGNESDSGISDDSNSSSTESTGNVTVQGNVISWGDDGWYQVQDANSFASVCEGGSSCSVPAGTYIVINHTNGVRVENVTVEAASDEPEQTTLPLIREDTWPDILRNAITVLNGVQIEDLHNRVRTRIGSLTIGASIDSSAYNSATQTGSLTSSGLSLLPLQDPNNLRLLDYVCPNGGTLTITASPVSQDNSVADNCLVEDVTLNGSFVANFVGREGGSSTLDDIVFDFADGSMFSITGRHRTQFDRVGIRSSISWSDMNFSEVSGLGEYRVNDFNVSSRSEIGQDFSALAVPVTLEDGSTVFARRVFHNAEISGSFSVVADWTSFLSLSVSAGFNLGGGTFLSTDEDRPQQWTTGSVVVTAPDGSSVTLEALPNDDSNAAVTIGGSTERQLVSWSDGYQVWCFASPDDLSLCSRFSSTN